MLFATQEDEAMEHMATFCHDILSRGVLSLSCIRDRLQVQQVMFCASLVAHLTLCHLTLRVLPVEHSEGRTSPQLCYGV